MCNLNKWYSPEDPLEFFGLTFRQEKPKKTRKSLDSSGLSQDELLKQQQELFARARNALKNSQDNLADPKRVT